MSNPEVHSRDKVESSGGLAMPDGATVVTARHRHAARGPEPFPVGSASKLEWHIGKFVRNPMKCRAGREAVTREPGLAATSC